MFLCVSVLVYDDSITSNVLRLNVYVCVCEFKQERDATVALHGPFFLTASSHTKLVQRLHIERHNKAGGSRQITFSHALRRLSESQRDRETEKQRERERKRKSGRKRERERDDRDTGKISEANVME